MTPAALRSGRSALTALLLLAASPAAPACEREAGEGPEPSRAPTDPAAPIEPERPAPPAPIVGAPDEPGHEGSQPRAVPDAGVGNVYLIVIDTLRADVTSLFPGGFEATPFLAELARKSVLYKRAYSTSSWTVPAMYSLMTGLYPSQHGMTRGSAIGGAVAEQSMLPDQAYTLAEQMRDLGYDTYAVCTNQHLAGKFGMAQGFRRFVGDGFSKLPFGEFAMDALSPEILAAGRRFVWLHYFDPHHPYNTIRPWFDEWNDSGFADYQALAIDSALHIYRERNHLSSAAPLPFNAISTVFDSAMAMRWTSPHRYFAAYGGKAEPPHEGTPEARYLKFLRAAYASEVRTTDESIRRMAERLRFDDRDLVIVVSDHGEELMERGRIGHRFIASVSQELIHVPLLIKYPGNVRGGTAVGAPASLVDIVPTIRGLLGQPPLDGLPGRDLSAKAAAPPAGPTTVFGELTEGNVELRYAVGPKWKLVRNERTRRRQLFDLSRDPQEKGEVSDAHPGILMGLEAELEAWKAIDVPAWPPGRSARLTAVELQRLRAMGYVQ